VTTPGAAAWCPPPTLTCPPAPHRSTVCGEGCPEQHRVAFWRKCDKSSSTRTGRAKPVTRALGTRLRRVGLTSMMSSHGAGTEGLPTTKHGIIDQVIPNRNGTGGPVANVSAGAHQPEGARRGGEEEAEVACADRVQGASEVQTPEEDLARQVETRHACPAGLRSGHGLSSPFARLCC
jgi:hypothetical protein